MIQIKTIGDELTTTGYYCDRCGKPAAEGNILHTLDPLPARGVVSGNIIAKYPRSPVRLHLMTRHFKTHELVPVQLCTACEDAFHPWYQERMCGVVTFSQRHLWENTATERERYLGRRGAAVNIRHNAQAGRYEIWNDVRDWDGESVHLAEPRPQVEEVCLAWQATHELCIVFCESMLWYPGVYEVPITDAAAEG
jgi:hypothetical protein